MSDFEELVDQVVDRGLTESAVLYYYFLVNYPYLQGLSTPEAEGAAARAYLGRKFSEVSPPGWKGTVKAMKRHKGISNPFALAWAMKKRGAKSHYPDRD